MSFASLAGIVCIYYILLIHQHVDGFGKGCGKGYNECDLGNWMAWGRCDARCGGGTHTRKKAMCCDVNKVKTLDECLVRCNMTKDEFNNKTTESQPCGQVCNNKGKFNVSTSKCECVNGTWGHCCELQINECSSNPCHHGYCYDRLFSYFCRCRSGYYGGHCEHGYCDHTKCGVHQSCIAKRVRRNTTYVYEPSCVCNLGYYGNKCQLGYCDNTTCENNSTCYTRRLYRSRHYVYEPTCRCLRGYYGNLCQYIDACLNRPCMNNGRCIRAENNFTCQCRQCFTGRHCEQYTNYNATFCPSTTTNLPTTQQKTTVTKTPDPTTSKKTTAVKKTSHPTTNPTALPTHTSRHPIYNQRPHGGGSCVSSPCQYGSCVQMGQDYFCFCSPGYAGRHCEIDKDDCAEEPCSFGHCIDMVNKYKCDCNMFFTGINCIKMKWWGIMSLCLAALAGLLILCCCLYCISSCTSKREDEDTIEKQFAPRIVKPPPFTKKPIKAWMG
ncbi:fibropellin-1-like [Mytilus edulis]|uniref:fibropellin-1-like n=1 Tax=Mytilus edulis TaxID=6550 RepID=UPI0039EF75EA